MNTHSVRREQMSNFYMYTYTQVMTMEINGNCIGFTIGNWTSVMLTVANRVGILRSASPGTQASDKFGLKLKSETLLS